MKAGLKPRLADVATKAGPVVAVEIALLKDAATLLRCADAAMYNAKQNGRNQHRVFTARLSQRYMRALAHIPLLSMVNPERVLVIGFGVGNSTQAATLHPSVTHVDVADLSRHAQCLDPHLQRGFVFAAVLVNRS